MINELVISIFNTLWLISLAKDQSHSFEYILDLYFFCLRDFFVVLSFHLHSNFMPLCVYISEIRLVLDQRSVLLTHCDIECNRNVSKSALELK